MKPRVKRNFIWFMPAEEFAELCHSSKTIAEIIRSFGLSYSGRSVHIIKERAKLENIDISHIPLGIASNKNRPVSFSKEPLEHYFHENGTAGRRRLKQLIKKHNLMEIKCSVCGLGEMWNDKPIVLILDHINGIYNDHRLENLRLVCPNCNSQLPTFTGRNKKYKKNGSDYKQVTLLKELQAP